MLISFLLMRAHTAMYEIELFSYNKHKLISFHLIFLYVIWILKHILMFIENNFFCSLFFIYIHFIEE